MRLTFIIPVFNEHHTLAPLVEGIDTHAGGLAYRVLFIDDGSTDGSFAAMQALRRQYGTVDLIKFRRNYGKTRALEIGFQRARGDVVFTMDADLQDDPAEIPRLLAKLEEGYDLVCGWKRNRHDPWHKVLPSRIFNGTVALMFGLRLHDINTGFKAMRLEVARRMPMRGDLHRFIPVFAKYLGYRVAEVAVEHHPRRYGHSKYGLSRFYQGGRDALSLWLQLVVLRRPFKSEAPLEPPAGIIEVEELG